MTDLENVFEQRTISENDPSGQPPARKSKRFPGIPGWILICLTVAWLVFIFSNSLKSASDSTEDSNFVLGILSKLFPAITETVVRKLAHFSEFAVLGALSGATFLVLWRRRVLLTGQKEQNVLPANDARAEKSAPVRQNNRLVLCFCGFLPLFGLLAALTDETLQYFSPGRAPMVSDVWIDAGGYAAGLVVVAAIWLIATTMATRSRNRNTGNLHSDRKSGKMTR